MTRLRYTADGTNIVIVASRRNGSCCVIVCHAHVAVGTCRRLPPERNTAARRTTHRVSVPAPRERNKNQYLMSRVARKCTMSACRAVHTRTAYLSSSSSSSWNKILRLSCCSDNRLGARFFASSLAG